MKKVILAAVFAALSVWAGGCRLFCDDHTSRCCGREPTPAYGTLPAP
jgi:hypothetical protein